MKKKVKTRPVEIEQVEKPVEPMPDNIEMILTYDPAEGNVIRPRVKRPSVKER